MAEKATRETPPKGEPPPQEEELTPFERMKRLTKAVVQVRKTEIVKKQVKPQPKRQ